MQETFVQGFRYLGGLRKPERFPAWIARIARNMAQAIGRGRRRELSRQERWSLDDLPSPAPATHAEDEPVGETLGQALSALPDAHRESLVLFYLQGNSVREAAALLGISEGAFKVRLHRARGKLREAMEERLEKSLRDLSPRKGLRERILAVVPAFPLGWGAGRADWVALFAVLLPVLAAILGALPGLVVQWYLYRRLAAELPRAGRVPPGAGQAHADQGLCVIAGGEVWLACRWSCTTWGFRGVASLHSWRSSASWRCAFSASCAARKCSA